jgi:branched-chain amino acid transport system substrate-binding protein
MMMSLQRGFVAAVGAAAFVVATALPSAAATSGAPVEINAVLSMTGGGAFFGQAEARALKVIEAMVNAGNGVRGRPVVFTVFDDQTSPQVAVQLTNQLIAKNVPLMLGPSTPGGCFAIAPIIDKPGPVAMCLNPSGHPAPGSFQYAPFADSSEVAIATLRYLRGRGITRLALFNSTDASGHDADTVFEAALKLPENRSVQKVAEEHFSPGDISVAAQITHIKNAGAQAIVSFETGQPFGTVLRGMRDAGLDVPVATTGGNMTFTQMQQYAAFLPNDILFGGTVAWSPGDARVPAVRKAQLAYLAALDKAGMKPEGGYATVWDPAMLAVDALNALGPDVDATKMRSYLAGLHGWIGIQGTYDFRQFPQRGVGADAVLVMRWDDTKKAFVSGTQAVADAPK